jgi:BlaR1 peptidase M56
MVVEAIFWFHPLVWWLGGRLVEERERACDEAVLQWVREPQVYAESILKTCEFCVASRLGYGADVAGGDLKKRLVRIMTDRIPCKLGVRKKLLLGLAGLLATGAPIGFGLAHTEPVLTDTTQDVSPPASELAPATTPTFKAVSIRRYGSDKFGRRYGFSSMNPPYDGKFYATDVTTKRIVQMAYGVQYSWLIYRRTGFAQF